MISSGGWSVVNYDVVNGGVVQSEWKVGGSGVTQKSTGADPTIYLYDTVLSNVRIRGSFSMNTISGWNGSVGFVFGYQDAGNYYLLEWRNGEGDDCGTKALSGLRLKKVQTTPAGSMPDTCPVFWTSVDGEWTHQGNPSAKTTVTMLPGGISANWAPKRTFEIIIDYRPGQIQIVLREGDTIYATITSNDNTFASGKFGFYNNNVYEALYQNFTILSLP